MKLIKLAKQMLKHIIHIIRGKYILSNFPPGHFYSTIPSLSEIKERRSEIFCKEVDVKGIDLNEKEQIEKLKSFSRMHEDVPFYSEEKRIRFNIENDSFSYDDAPILHFMMRLLNPKRIIEIGSGYSSACMLDTSTLYLNNAVDFTFIDLDCSNLRNNLSDSDYEKVLIIEKPVQVVDLNIFKSLEANDMLFIDSSHVIKAGSDLATIFFEILPVLKPGVYIHFHDIRYPFQYPESSIMGGIFWNEAYLLRAFLQNNDSFKITFWLNCLLNKGAFEIDSLLSFLPLDGWDRRFNNNKGDYTGAGGSIYIKKIK